MQLRLKWQAFFAEAIIGGLVGWGCAVLFGRLGARLFVHTRDGWGDLIASVLGGIIGYTIGVSIGVYLAGRWFNRRNGGPAGPERYVLALLGSGLGMALVLALAEPLWLNRNTTVLETALAISAPILATLFFNLRRWRGFARARSA